MARKTGNTGNCAGSTSYVLVIRFISLFPGLLSIIIFIQIFKPFTLEFQHFNVFLGHQGTKGPLCPGGENEVADLDFFFLSIIMDLCYNINLKKDRLAVV